VTTNVWQPIWFHFKPAAIRHVGCSPALDITLPESMRTSREPAIHRLFIAAACDTQIAWVSD
jgi:hypothetical protein